MWALIRIPDGSVSHCSRSRSSRTSAGIATITPTGEPPKLGWPEASRLRSAIVRSASWSRRCGVRRSSEPHFEFSVASAARTTSPVSASSSPEAE